jgi:hypothetical protein
VDAAGASREQHATRAEAFVESLARAGIGEGIRGQGRLEACGPASGTARP